MSHLSYIEKLLDGVEVEWRPLEKVIHSLKTGLNPRKNFQLNTSDAQGYYVTVREIQDGKIVFLEKTDRVNDRALELINGRSNLEVGDILFSGTGTVGRTAVIEEKPANWNIKEGVYTIKPIQEKILPRFLSHLLNSSEIVKDYGKKIVGNPVVSLPMGELKKLLVPIPCPENPKKSLEIQAEIVRILDAFTAMTAELTAELNLRKQQYNYYRDQLLRFEEGEVEWKTLGELTIEKFWIMPATPKFDENEDVPYITSKNIRGGDIFFDKVKFISRDDFIKLSRNRPILAGDFLISMIGTIGEVARVKKEDLDFYGQNMYLIRLDEDLLHGGYFLHFFDSPRMKNHFNSVKNNSGQGYLKANNIDGISVPVPPLSEQARIVAILDKFDALTNSITEGLPREIELRQKQYEYYRDLLLSFPKSNEEAVA